MDNPDTNAASDARPKAAQSRELESHAYLGEEGKHFADAPSALREQNREGSNGETGLVGVAGVIDPVVDSRPAHSGHYCASCLHELGLRSHGQIQIAGPTCCNCGKLAQFVANTHLVTCVITPSASHEGDRELGEVGTVGLSDPAELFELPTSRSHPE